MVVLITGVVVASRLAVNAEVGVGSGVCAVKKSFPIVTIWGCCSDRKDGWMVGVTKMPPPPFATGCTWQPARIKTEIIRSRMKGIVLMKVL
jgi:hypothetical protein